MKKLLLIFLLIFGLNVFSSIIPANTIDPKKEKIILDIVFKQLQSKHLITKKIDDNFSKKVFKQYIHSIDYYKVFLLQSDIDEFKKYETKLDDQIKNNDLTFFYLTYDRIKARMIAGKEIYTNLIKNGIDLNENEKVFVEENINFENTKVGQIKRWKAIIKSEIYSNTISSCKLDNKKYKFDKIKLDSAFAKYSTYYSRTFLNRMESTAINVDNFSREEFLSRFINAFVLQFDQHSYYYIPSKRDEYLVKQTGKIEGIGVSFQIKENFTQISALTIDAPAWKTKKIDVGDILLKVAQENEEAKDVVGYSLYDVAKLTRGKSGTNIKLTIKKNDGSIVVVPIKRAVVSSNDSYIKSCLVEKNNVKYAVISFPRFYNDFDDDLVRNAADDFEDELQILKESDVQGIIIDIRGNGGGSVEAVIQILSNFIDKATILQVKNKENKIFKFETLPNAKKWDKSLVLLINNETASAAEIFASAFQDFNIGVVLGRETFGKGTIQEFIDLNSFNSNKNDKTDFGMLKITTQRFYRPNGKSVQKNGIIPEIVFPQEAKESREKNLEFAIIPDAVAPNDFKTENPEDYYTKIIKNCDSRIANNIYFNSLKKNKPDTFDIEFTSYIYNKVKQELYQFLEKQNAIEFPTVSSNLDFKSTPADVKLFKQNKYLIAKRADWYKQLKTDLQIDECLNVLEDSYSKK